VGIEQAVVDVVREGAELIDQLGLLRTGVVDIETVGEIGDSILTDRRSRCRGEWPGWNRTPRLSQNRLRGILHNRFEGAPAQQCAGAPVDRHAESGRQRHQVQHDGFMLSTEILPGCSPTSRVSAALRSWWTACDRP
jgi:hypothetical protein